MTESNDEVVARIKARRARSREIIEGLRPLIEQLEAEKAAMTIPEDDGFDWKNYERRERELAQLALWPNGLPICMEIRDYYGRTCGVYRPAGGRRYGRRR